MIVQLLSNTPCLLAPYCSQGIAVIFLQDGIYSAAKLLFEYPHNTFYALAQDYQASGLPELTDLILISNEQWVDLCAVQHPVVTLQQ